MKPSRSPQRRTHMKPGRPLKRRTRIKAVSDQRQAESGVRAEARQRVYDRDSRCLLAGHPDAPPCFGRRTPHHLRKAGQGGPYNELNLVTLCEGHNDWVETVRPWAHRHGLEMRRGDTYAEVWTRLATAKLVTYTWTGQPLAAA